MAAITVVLYLSMIAVNELLLIRFEFVRGINWIYLPAGMRLLSILLFAEAGAIGVLIGTWIFCFFYFFPGDPISSSVGAIVAAAAPYLVYRVMLVGGARTLLADLTPLRLLGYALAFSIASPLLHHIWFALQGQTDSLLRGFLVMVAGDFAGTLIVLYVAKGALALAGGGRER